MYVSVKTTSRYWMRSLKLLSDAEAPRTQQQALFCKVWVSAMVSLIR